jgi:cell division protease FtsH
MRRLPRAAVLLIAVALLLVLFALDHVNSGNSYRQARPSEVVSLINQGEVESALIINMDQTIRITIKSGRQLEASWVSSQGSQLRNALQAQLDKGGLPGGYSVILAKSSAPLDVLAPAFIYLVIFLLFLLRIAYPEATNRYCAGAVAG